MVCAIPRLIAALRLTGNRLSGVGKADQRHVIEMPAKTALQHFHKSAAASNLKKPYLSGENSRLAWTGALSIAAADELP
ncbi:MAG: hypothetical protein EPN75_04135 [Beijerinckiaceae bacterium]|nr:MAG: hypothetical protein EPN75_04135 [Beijerinckiaceae bacterium]